MTFVLISIKLFKKEGICVVVHRIINLCLLYSVAALKKKKKCGIIKLLRTKEPSDCQLQSLKEQVNFSESHSWNFLTLTGSFHLVIKAIH